MFTTVDKVQQLTGYTVTNDLIYQAQGIIEVYSNRTESEVESIHDRGLMSKAVAYQAAYMLENSESVFKQVAVSQVGQNDSLVTYKAGDNTAPWIAPLAVLALNGLTWKQSRSIYTGRTRWTRRKARRWVAE